MAENEKEQKEELKEEKQEKKEKKHKDMVPKQDYDELDDRFKRILAEFENFKKRSNKEREGLYNSIIGDIISSLLPVIDNLEKATEAETKDEEYKKGIELVLKQFKDVLQQME